jgi:hypothetical protein
MDWFETELTFHVFKLSALKLITNTRVTAIRIKEKRCLGG